MLSHIFYLLLVIGHAEVNPLPVLLRSWWGGRPLTGAFFLVSYTMTTMDSTLSNDFDFDSVDALSSDIQTDLSSLEIAGVAVGGVTAATGVAALASMAPVYTTVLGAVAGGLAWTGYRKRLDLPLNPFEKGEAKSESTPATSNGVVENIAGQPVEVATL